MLDQHRDSCTYLRLLDDRDLEEVLQVFPLVSLLRLDRHVQVVERHFAVSSPLLGAEAGQSSSSSALMHAVAADRPGFPAHGPMHDPEG